MHASAGRQSFQQGIQALLPLAPGVLPFGLVTGVTAANQGYSFFEILGMTLLFYAGSAQMAALQLLNEQALPLVILITVVVINLRFLMYSAALAPHMHRLPAKARWPLGYMISDQSFALSMVRNQQQPHAPMDLWFFAGSSFSMWLVWQVSVILGVMVGSGIPASWSLDFAIPLSFLAILVPAIRNSASLSAALTGGLVAVLAHGLPYNLGLIVASVSGIAAGLLVETRQKPAASHQQGAKA